MFLDDVQFHWRLELAVGEVRETLLGTTDPGETLNMVIPRRNVGIADGPIDGYTLSGIGLKIQVAQSEAQASPHERSAADLVAAEPLEGLSFGVGIVDVVGPPILVQFSQNALAELDGMFGFQCERVASTMRHLPRAAEGVHIILDVLNVAPAFEQQHLEALLSQFLGGPTAADA
ncbi:MAG: hypothetical protein K1X42_10125 [Opitutaceae bacterium]|nr:hypothetical protein [Opitutaceae bacterium]